MVSPFKIITKTFHTQYNANVVILLENGKVFVKGSDRSSTGILGLGEDI